MSEIKTNKISSLASNNDITIDPDGTGDTIVASGKVGIGTTSPATVLHVQGADPNITIQDTNDTGDAFIRFKNNSGTQRGFIQTAMTGDVMLLGTGTTERMRLDSAGALLVHTTSRTGSSNLVVEADTSVENPMSVVNTRSSAATDFAIIFYRAGNIVGSVQTSLSATSFVTSSDYRLKTNVSYDWDATSRLKQLKPARFDWISDGDNAVPVDGFIAHEVSSIVPEAISGTKDEVDADGNPVMQGIDQSKIVPLLVKTILELEARITALEAE